MNGGQLRELIKGVLSNHNLDSDAAVELLMMTAAQESHCGRYIKQLGSGPALGIFQIEPATYNDLMENYLRYRPGLMDKVDNFFMDTQIPISYHLMGNIPFQILVARLQYYRFSEPLPDADDIMGLAKYYKKYWNTELGDATVHSAIRNYKTLAF